MEMEFLIVPLPGASGTNVPSLVAKLFRAPTKRAASDVTLRLGPQPR
jgi:hypothetical protein